MQDKRSTALVVASQAKVDIASAAEYRRVFATVRAHRERYYALHRQVLSIANSYFEQDSRYDFVVQLRRDIRLATKGTPVTHEQDTITEAAYVSYGTEQLYNAETHLVTAMYKKVRSLVHPDLGGDVELFQLVNTAYRLRDLTFLQETYWLLTKGADLDWQATSGLEWARQEVQRPNVSLTMLKTTPEFAIAQAHMVGRVDEAKALAGLRMSELVVELTAELNHLTNPRSSNGNKGSSKEGSIVKRRKGLDPARKGTSRSR